MQSTSFLTVCDSEGNQVCLWTLKREHHVMQSLQHSDQICAYVQLFVEEECIVLDGAVCDEYYADVNFILMNNSEV